MKKIILKLVRDSFIPSTSWSNRFIVISIKEKIPNWKLKENEYSRENDQIKRSQLNSHDLFVEKVFLVTRGVLVFVVVVCQVTRWALPIWMEKLYLLQEQVVELEKQLLWGFLHFLNRDRISIFITLRFFCNLIEFLFS